MRSRLAAFAASLLAVAVFSVAALTQPVLALASGAPGLSEDKGTFRILVNGKEAGKENFSVSRTGATWTVRGMTAIQSSQGTTNVTGTLELHNDGTPVKYAWATDGSQKASATIAFSGMTASISLRMGNAQPYAQQFTFASQPITILDNNLYDQYIVVAGLYDWKKGGPQTFSVLVPQELMPGAVTVESMGKQDVSGKHLDELRVKTEDLEVDLYLDKGRLIRIVAPGSGAEIVRD